MWCSGLLFLFPDGWSWTSLFFTSLFNSGSPKVYFSSCGAGGSSWGCLHTSCRQGIWLLCVSWSHLGGDSRRNAARIITQKSSIVCLTVHTNLTVSWAKYAGCNPNPKNCHPSTQWEDHIHGGVSGIHQKPSHRDRDRGDSDLKGQERNSPAGSWGSSPKTTVAFYRGSSAAAGHVHLSQSKLWFRGRKRGSVTLSQTALSQQHCIHCRLPLSPLRISQDIFGQTFGEQTHVDATHQAVSCLSIREHQKDKICSNSLFPLLIPGQGRLFKCSFFSVLTVHTTMWVLSEQPTSGNDPMQFGFFPTERLEFQYIC